MSGHPKAVPLALGGANRWLLYDLNALAQLKSRHGINLFQQRPAEEYQDPVVIRAVLWAGLLHEAPDLTIEQVGSWLTIDRLEPAVVAFLQAMKLSASPEVTLAPDPPQEVSSGTTSSASATDSSASPPSSSAG